MRWSLSLWVWTAFSALWTQCSFLFHFQRQTVGSGFGQGLYAESPVPFWSCSLLTDLMARLLINPRLAHCLCLVQKNPSLKKDISLLHTRVRLPCYTANLAEENWVRHISQKSGEDVIIHMLDPARPA